MLERVPGVLPLSRPALVSVQADKGSGRVAPQASRAMLNGG